MMSRLKEKLAHGNLCYLRIYCPNLKKKINIKWEDLEINGWESEPIEYYPRYSGYNMRFKCKCGTEHTFSYSN